MSERPDDPDRTDEPSAGRDGDLWSWDKQQPADPEPTAPYQPSQPSQPAQPSYPPPPPSPYPSPQQPQQPPYGAGSYGQPGYGPPTPYPPPGAWPGAGYVQPPPNDGLGTAAMIVGIASLVLACGYGIGLLASPVALFMGRASMKRIDAAQGALGGRGQAQAGFIMGIIGSVLLVVLLLLIAGITTFILTTDTSGTTSP